MGISKKILAVVLVFGLLVLFNVIGNYVSLKVDFTQEGLYTLSDGTRALLKKVNEPIHLEFYFSKEVEDLPVSFRNYGKRIENLLGEYVAAAHGKVTLEVIEPKPFSDEAVRAQTLGIRAQPTHGGDPLYFGLSVECLGQQEAIPFFQPSVEAEQFLEYAISKLLFSVQQADKPTLGVYSPALPILGQPGQQFNPQASASQSWLFVQQLKENYSIKPLSTAADFSENVDVLLVVHPDEITAEMEFAIDQFILSGRPTVVAVDPLSFVQQQMMQQPQQYAFMQPPATGAYASSLSTLFEHYGIQFSPTQVIGDLDWGVQSGTAMIPVFIAPDRATLDSDFLPVAGLKQFLFPVAGSLSLQESSPLAIEPIIQSSNQSSLLSSAEVSSAFSSPRPNLGALITGINPDGKHHVIAGVFSGRMTSAFPSGKPAAANEASAPAEQAENAPFIEAADKVQLLVVADTDWLFDGFAFRSVNIFGQTMVDAINDNFALIANLVDFYSGSPDLISIRSKRKTERDFVVIKRIQAEAKKRYEDAMLKLDEELGQVARKLSELQAQATQSNSLVIGSEMQAAIKEFEDKKIDLQNQQRKIREKLNEDVEREEIKLLVFNIAGVPLLVSLFGFIFLVRRYHNQ